MKTNYKIFRNERNKELLYFRKDPLLDLDKVLFNLNPVFKKWEFHFFTTLTNKNWDTIDSLKKDLKKELLKETIWNNKYEDALIYEFHKAAAFFIKKWLLKGSLTDSFSKLFELNERDIIKSKCYIEKFTTKKAVNFIMSFLAYAKKRKIVNEIYTKYKDYLQKTIETFRYFGVIEQHKNKKFHIHLFLSHPLKKWGTEVFDQVFLDVERQISTDKQIYSYITKYITKDLDIDLHKKIVTNIRPIFTTPLDKVKLAKTNLKYLKSIDVNPLKEKYTSLLDIQRNFFKKITIISGKPGTGKTFLMKQLHQEKTGIKPVLAITERRQRALNRELNVEQRNFFKYFWVRVDHSIGLPEQKSIDYLFLDDIWNLSEKLFVKIFNYINKSKLKHIYITYDPKQISTFNYTKYFKTEVLTKQWRTQNMILEETNSMLVNEENYIDFLNKVTGPWLLTNDRVLDSLQKYRFTDPNYKFTGTCYLTKNYKSLFNWTELNVVNWKVTNLIATQQIDIREILSLVRFYYNVFSVQWETVSTANVFYCQNQEKTSKPEHELVLKTRATELTRFTRFKLTNDFFRKIKK